MGRNKPKRQYTAKCWRCKEIKLVTFRCYKDGATVEVTTDEKTGQKVEVEKATYRRFPICFDCIKQPRS